MRVISTAALFGLVDLFATSAVASPPAKSCRVSVKPSNGPVWSHVLELDNNGGAYIRPDPRTTFAWASMHDCPPELKCVLRHRGGGRIRSSVFSNKSPFNGKTDDKSDVVAIECLNCGKASHLKEGSYVGVKVIPPVDGQSVVFVPMQSGQGSVIFSRPFQVTEASVCLGTPEEIECGFVDRRGVGKPQDRTYFFGSNYPGGKRLGNVFGLVCHHQKVS